MGKVIKLYRLTILRIQERAIAALQLFVGELLREEDIKTIGEFPPLPCDPLSPFLLPFPFISPSCVPFDV